MRTKRIIAAFAGVVLTGALATTIHANAATAPTHQVAVQRADQTKSLQQIHQLGLLGDLTSAVDAVARSAKANPRPSAADLQSQVDRAKAAAAALQAELQKPANATKQGMATRSLASDLAKLNADLATLASDLQANPTAVPGDLAAIAADLVAIVGDVTGVLDAPAAATH
ncbi:hypothetical protein [Kitasatospora sp. GP82]|uniref:hypothetical protein n=1 Tax=Kitasatospora sp. GP82 TaxID=3035089 RepID=UPI002476C790|nr:hypothetical protein [Kitasatospora sp. GP82]MDH6127455.1 hypothetical protein [Kitasatospora sp. GP82]